MEKFTAVPFRCFSFRKASLKTWAAAILLLSSGAAQAGYLFTGVFDDRQREEFIVPDLNYSGGWRYSEWDRFYARHTALNYPDVYARYGGADILDEFGQPTGAREPIARTQAGFEANPLYNPADPDAFWHTANATIAQTGTTNAILAGGGNIYSFAAPIKLVVSDNTMAGPDPFQVGTVVFQFQTEGMLMDFSTIRLVYVDSDGQEGYIYATDLEHAQYVREFQATGGGSSEHWSSTSGYRNRVAIQWDLTGILGANGGPITGEYRIELTAESSSMSFQQAALDANEIYQEGIAGARIWEGGSGEWSDSANWYKPGSNGGYGIAPVENGNLHFENSSAAVINLTADHTLGELIFRSANDVTISSDNGSALVSNTGVSTLEGANGNYLIDVDMEFAAVNFFTINDGVVTMGGVLSGAFGMVKDGEGKLILTEDNTFAGFLAIQEGELRIENANSFGGNTTVLNGTLTLAYDVHAGSGALGTSLSAVAVGADEALYENVGGTLEAAIILDGDRTFDRNIEFAAGNHEKRLGSINTTDGAVFRGDLEFGKGSADPTAPAHSGNVFFTAKEANDRLEFAGTMRNGGSAYNITLDGQGTVVYSEVAKAYHNSTIVGSGRLLIADTSGYTGNGHFTVAAGARLIVDGFLSGAGNLTLAGGSYLGGSGSVNRTFTLANGAVLAPGNSVGKLTTTSQIWQNGGIVDFEIDENGWDQINLVASGSSIGNLTLDLTGSDTFLIRISGLTEDLVGEEGLFDGSADNYWTFLKAVGGIEGFDASRFTFDASGLGAAFNGTFGIEQHGDELWLTYAAAPIPEPSTYALMGAGAALYGFLRRRRKAA